MVEARVLVSRSHFPERNHSDAFGFLFPLSHLFTYQLRQVQVQEMLSFVDHPDHHDVQFWNCHISAFALQAARVAVLEGHRGFFMDVGIGIRMVDRNPWPVFVGGAELVDESLILSSDGEFGEAEAVNEIMMISLEENAGEFGGVPASKSSVSALETRRFEGVLGHESSSSTSSASACVVCLEDFQAGVEVTAMPCSHEFHCTCLAKWLERSHHCPLCRFPMPTADS